MNGYGLTEKDQQEAEAMAEARRRYFDGMEEVSPPGFEHVVQALKDRYPSDKERPFQIAWAMHGQGIKPKSESGQPYDAAALTRRHEFLLRNGKREDVHGLDESLGSTGLGALLRKGAMTT